MIANLKSFATRQSIARKFYLAGIFLTVCFAVLAVAAFQATRSLEILQSEAENQTRALRNHIESDMMHDAMRSTVLMAIQAGLTGNRETARSAQADLKEYSEWLDRLHQANTQLTLPQDEMARIRSVEAAFDKYVVRVKRIVEVAPRDVAAGNRLMSDFEAQFRAMEISNEQVSDFIEQRVTESREDVNAQAEWLRQINLAMGLLSIGIIIGVIVFLNREIIRPVVRIAQNLENENSTDLTQERVRKDEIGRLAIIVEEFRNTAAAAREAEMAKAAAEAEKAQLAQREVERREALAETSRHLERRVIEISGKLSQTTAQLKSVAAGLAETADKTRDEASSAVKSADENLAGVIAIAEASDEMLVSIGEISQRIGSAAQSTSQVRSLSDEARHAMSDIDGMSGSVSKVAVLIGDIASRTSMLALNATIEASRAGEAGKGFGVVASEVSTLAQQTSEAVRNIDALIKSMSGSTDKMTRSIARVSTAMEDLDEIASSIAAAAEQQGLAANEIGNTIHRSSSGTEAVRENLRQMGSQVERTATGANAVLEAAHDLDQQAADLDREIASFMARSNAA